MDRDEIIKVSKKVKFNDLEKARNDLEKDYEISYGQYNNYELKKALEYKKPIVIKDHFLIGYEGGKFIDINENKISIDKLVKAVIVEEIKQIPSETPERDDFVIIGRNEWEDISQFNTVLNNLKVGEIFLPPHSAVFNFLNSGEKEKKEKIVSCLAGININIYSHDNYVDNAIHEIGHLFWRDCVNIEEKKAFKEFFQFLKPSAIYEHDWERANEEEVFCTIYKWFVKSILLNNSFYNILAFEEPKGLTLFQQILNRVARDRQIIDIWNMNKQEIMDYLNPKYDISSGKKMRKAGILDRIKDIELPDSVLLNIEKFEDGVEYIRLEKAIVPVKDNKIDWERCELPFPKGKGFLDQRETLKNLSPQA